MAMTVPSTMTQAVVAVVEVSVRQPTCSAVSAGAVGSVTSVSAVAVVVV